MREKSIESKLTAEVRRVGGLAPKFVSPGLDGVPDRLILLPGGKVAFAELNYLGRVLCGLSRLSVESFHICEWLLVFVFYLQI